MNNLSVEKFIDIYDKTPSIDLTGYLNGYIPIIEKISKIDMVIDITNHDANNDNALKFNSVAQYIFMAMAFIDLFTKIDVDYSKLLDEYDMLRQRGLIDTFHNLVDKEEYDEFEYLFELSLEDFMKNQGSTLAQVNNILLALIKEFNPIVEQIVKELQDLPSYSALKEISNNLPTKVQEDSRKQLDDVKPTENIRSEKKSEMKDSNVVVRLSSTKNRKKK